MWAFQSGRSGWDESSNTNRDKTRSGIKGWPFMSNRKACLIASIFAGVTGLLVFLVIHHLWIKPIWFIARLVFVLGPGHNVLFLGNPPATGKGILLLIAIVLAASIVFVEGHAALIRRHNRSDKSCWLLMDDKEVDDG